MGSLGLTCDQVKINFPVGVLEPSKVHTGPILTGKIQFLNQEKTAVFTPELQV
jgi:hypothetical protein